MVRLMELPLIFNIRTRCADCTRMNEDFAPLDQKRASTSLSPCKVFMIIIWIIWDDNGSDPPQNSAV